jgi:hypothetical protein
MNTRRQRDRESKRKKKRINGERNEEAGTKGDETGRNKGR